MEQARKFGKVLASLKISKKLGTPLVIVVLIAVFWVGCGPRLPGEGALSISVTRTHAFGLNGIQSLEIAGDGSAVLLGDNRRCSGVLDERLVSDLFAVLRQLDRDLAFAIPGLGPDERTETGLFLVSVAPAGRPDKKVEWLSDGSRRYDTLTAQILEIGHDLRQKGECRAMAAAGSLRMAGARHERPASKM